MAIIASAKSGNFVPVSEGVHTAVCIWVIDLGDQYSEKFDNTSRKVQLTWETLTRQSRLMGNKNPG